ncbi:hypothetical protein WA538_005974, partial [Blastocystis sp. DL]
MSTPNLKLFGNKEAPEWFVTNVLRFSRFSEKTIKTLTEAAIDSIVTGTLKYSKIEHLISSKDQIPEIKAVLGTLSVLIKNAVKYSLTEVMLSGDLQHVGLAHPYQLSICRPYSDNKQSLTQVLGKRCLLLSGDVQWDWDIQAMINDNGGRYICSSIAFQLSSPKGLLLFQEGEQKRVQQCGFTTTESVYYRLSEELRKANSLMSLYSKSY